jgi:thioredoxin 1
MEINDILELDSLIRNSPSLLIYFYNDNCAPCKALRPKVIELMDFHFPLIRVIMINAGAHPEISGQFNIFSSPTILLLFDGKEVLRESKYVSIEELKSKVERYYELYFH